MSLPETLRERRGHDFYPPADLPIPAIGRSAKGDPDTKTVFAHYFVGGCDWWLTEYDRRTGEGFGYAVLNGDWQNAEWGYVSLPELEEINIRNGLAVVERDCFWDSQPMGDVLAGRR